MKTRIVLVLVFGLLIAWSLKTTLFRDGNGSKKNNDQNVAESSLTEEVHSFSLTGYSESGEEAWKIHGRNADIHADVINLFEISADSFNKKITVNLVADEGFFDKKSNNIQLKDNVIVTTSEETTLNTQSLSWNAKDEFITTDDLVYIKRKDIDIEGIGATASPGLEKARLAKDVKLLIKEHGAVISCDGPLDIDYNKNIAYFYNKVGLDDGQTKIKADKAIAYFDPEKRDISKVICEGNVEITKDGNITNAKVLTYLPNEKRVILSGRPKIVINSADELMKEYEKK
ncbi:LPS export ABC transporter periplasmic protein LptC [Candidatus Omnitrophota bacterium]